MLPVGFQLHIVDLYLEEVAKVSKGELTHKTLSSLLTPFMEKLKGTVDQRLETHIEERVFNHLMRQSDLGIAYDEYLDDGMVIDEEDSDGEEEEEEEGDEIDDGEDDEEEEEFEQDEEEMQVRGLNFKFVGQLELLHSSCWQFISARITGLPIRPRNSSSSPYMKDR